MFSSISFIRLLFLELFLEITAQIATGNQPIKVNCSNKAITAANILPLNKKESEGKRIAPIIRVDKP